ncbi:MAG: adenylate/guanylate cyclase domain-containing protein [Xanthobacteraceae bacterium]|nr:adenylate/guanylate cyclase domain-containing protein [Xanthobacteraceae bacterium]
MAESQSRRLAAILAADIAGYSALMGSDEARTVTDLKGHQAVVLPMVGNFGGRIIDTAGDGILAEFASVVNAVECAVAIQRAMAERNTAVDPKRRMQFRIGINLGDVIYDENRIFGDGINIAARLEGIATPGGICVSAKVRDEIDGKINFAYEDMGDRQLKNIARPVRVYGIRLDAAPAAPAHSAQTTAAAEKPDDKPSIAVLPFTNMSGDPEQEYFSDGISEDIITDLSKIAGLTVIARNSSFTYKGRSVDVRTVGRELSVRSVLEGSIRRAGQRVRITAQLIDAATGAHVWAERYDRDLTDIFEVQDDVTRRIVGALKVTLTPAENAHLTSSGTSNIDAYDSALRGRELLLGNRKNRDTFEQAKACFLQAIELDPNYAQAIAGLGFAYMFDYQNRWSGDPDSSLPLAKRYAERAIEKNPKEPLARVVAAVAATFSRDLDEAKSQIEVALLLNPNFAMAYNVLGTLRSYAGQPLEAIPVIEHAMRLDPAFNAQYLHFLGMAHLLAGNYEKAAALLRQRIVLVPETDFSRSALASALGHLGEIDEARRVWGELKKLNPKYSFSEHFSRLPFKKEEDVRHIAEGLAKAGLD